MADPVGDEYIIEKRRLLGQPEFCWSLSWRLYSDMEYRQECFGTEAELLERVQEIRSGGLGAWADYNGWGPKGQQLGLRRKFGDYIHGAG